MQACPTTCLPVVTRKHSMSPPLWVQENRTVGIIGAGVAGLQVAAALKQAGIQVALYERSHNVGGVWQYNYAGYKLQVQRWHYDIVGYPWPEGTSYPYPTGAEVQAYLEGYARDSGLLPHIRFNAELQAVSPLGDGGDEGWLISYTQRAADGTQLTNSDEVAFLVFATGLFNTPSRPGWATPEAVTASRFAGDLVDARDFTEAEAARGKHVLVIGAGKTAIDVAVTVSEVAASSTILARKGHVWAPQWVLGLIPFEWAAYTRWSWALQPAWYTASPVENALHLLFAPLKAAAWKLFEVLFPLHTATPVDLQHPHSLLEGIYDTIGIVDAPKVRAAFNSGALQGVKGEVAALTAGGVRCTDGKALKADIIVLATGYQSRDQQLLAESLRPLAGYEADGNQWLYRNLLPVGLRNMAFVGLNATFQHVLTTALQARWLTAVLTGELKLPTLQQQGRYRCTLQAWLLSAAFPFKRTNNFVWAQHGKFHDQLVKDLGYSPRRKGWNLAAELFTYITNEDYVDVIRAGRRGFQSPACHPNGGHGLSMV